LYLLTQKVAQKFGYVLGIEKKVRMAVGNTEKAEHTLRVRPMQPGIVFEKILINLGGYKPTHLGMLESPYVR
uniref:hypothetical protein n=1 Tax=Segatella copri TaxID=165179 RepID=UPI003FF0E596